MRRDIRTLKKIVSSESVSQWVSETAKIKDSLKENIYLGNLCGEKERKKKKARKSERKRKAGKSERKARKRERTCKLHII